MLNKVDLEIKQDQDCPTAWYPSSAHNPDGPYFIHKISGVRNIEVQ